MVLNLGSKPPVVVAASPPGQAGDDRGRDAGHHVHEKPTLEVVGADFAAPSFELSGDRVRRSKIDENVDEKENIENNVQGEPSALAREGIVVGIVDVKGDAQRNLAIGKKQRDEQRPLIVCRQRSLSVCGAGCCDEKRNESF